MPKPPWIDLVGITTVADLAKALQACTRCGLVIYTGLINQRGDDEPAYYLSGQEIHDPACTFNIGLGPQVPPVDPTA